MRRYGVVWTVFLVLLLSIPTALAESTAIDETNFPDPLFRKYIQETFDTDGDGALSDAERLAVTDMSLTAFQIRDLTGMALFPNLESIYGAILIREIDLSGNPGVKSLRLSACEELTTVKLGGAQLTNVWIHRCAVTSLDLSGCASLTHVDVGENTGLTSVQLGAQPALTELKIYGNPILSSLDVSGCPNLTSLDCTDNRLTSLDVSSCPKLKTLLCGSNRLTGMDVSACSRLEYLDCSRNPLTALDLSGCPALNRLGCAYTSLCSLDLSGNPALVSNYYIDDNGPSIEAVDGTYDLSLLPGFDMSRSTFPGLVDEYLHGTVISVGKSGDYDYQYDCGNGISARFVLHIQYVPSDLTGWVTIDEAHFPDAAFRELVASSAYDTDQDGLLSPYEQQRSVPFQLKGTGISSLEGIQYFSGMYLLECSGLPLGRLDVSGCANLTHLECIGCGLTSLDVSGCERLSNLFCSDNMLTVLDVSGCPSLGGLNCANNLLTSLDVSACPQLREVHCEDNVLSRLTMGDHFMMQRITCQNNRLRSLDVTGYPELLYLTCSNNLLTSLDVRNNAKLWELECESNMLSALDLSGNSRLYKLNCMDNQITSLDLSHSQFSSLNCAYNQLSCLNISEEPLTELACVGNVRSITLPDTFLYLPNLPGFDPKKASDWSRGFVRDKTLYITESGLVTYQYDIGYDIKVEFALDIILASQQGEAVPIDEAHFPDAAFRSYVASVADKDGNGALNEAERNAVETLDVSDMGIASLQGLQYFDRLQGLSCADNQLTSLDVSGNPALAILDCSGNRLTALDLSGNPTLQMLGCADNGLTALDVSVCPNLLLLDCAGNCLTSLDISGNPALIGLDCGENSRAVTADQGVFDLSTLPGFDPTRASQWTGATVEGTKAAITASGPVTYLYDCGRDVQILFTLDVTVTNPPIDPTEALRNKPGNVNGDAEGIVDGRDVLRLARFLAGEGVTINEKAADVNADGQVDGRDVLRLARYLAGEDVELKQAP